MKTATAIVIAFMTPSIFYDIQASKNYIGIFIPDIAMNTEIKVQVR